MFWGSTFSGGGISLSNSMTMYAKKGRAGKTAEDVQALKNPISTLGLKELCQPHHLGNPCQGAAELHLRPTLRFATALGGSKKY